MGRRAKGTGLRRVAEYRRMLASLPDETVGAAVACFMFSSIHQKIRFCDAMRKVEAEPGFARWLSPRRRASSKGER